MFLAFAVLSGLWLGNINVFRIIRSSDALKKFNDYSTDDNLSYEITCEPNYLDEDRQEIKFGKSDPCVVHSTIMEILHTPERSDENRDYFTIVLVVCVLSS